MKCIHCPESRLFHDYVRDELICTNCGLVIEKLFHFSNSGHFVNNEPIYDTSITLLEKICRKYSMNQDVVTSSLEYLQYHHTTNSQIDNKTLCCAIHSIESSLSSTQIIALSSQMKVDIEQVFHIVNKVHKKPTNEQQRELSSSFAREWYTSLETELMEQVNSTSTNRQKIAQIKIQLHELIENKPHCLYYCAKVIISALLFHHNITTNHNIPISKLIKICHELFE